MVTQKHGEYVYVGDARIDGDTIQLSEPESHHLIRVRRVRIGEEVMATDGRGIVYRATVSANDKLDIHESLPEYGECKTHLLLACGNLQGDTSREVVSAAVQLGVRELCWVRMARSQENYSQNKLDKLQRVAIQATKQTGRARLIELRTANGLSEFIESQDNTTYWVAHPESLADVKQHVNTEPRKHSLIVGPEGGFDSEELELLTRKANVIKLGQRRLRSETAVTAGLTYLLAQFNEL